MFVISIPTLESRIHRREDGMDSPREAALCGDCRGKYFHLSTHAFYVYYGSLMANGTDEDRVSVAVCLAVFVFQKRYRVSEVYVRNVAETVIAVRTAQLRHMSETVVWRFVFLVSIDILHFKALMTSVATPWIRSSCRLSAGMTIGCILSFFGTR